MSKLFFIFFIVIIKLKGRVINIMFTSRYVINKDCIIFVDREVAWTFIGIIIHI